MSKIPFQTVELLREAVASGDYAEAESLLGSYRAETQARWAAAASAEQRAAIEADVSELLGWARTVTLAARSHMQRKLIQLTCAKAYTAYPPHETSELSEIRR